MFWHGAKFLLVLGRPWLFSLAARYGRVAAIGLLGIIRQRRLAARLAAAEPRQLAAMILPFLQQHGFKLQRQDCDDEGVLLAGTVQIEGGRQLLLVRVQTAEPNSQVLEALIDAAGADAHALLIGNASVPEELRIKAQNSGRSLGVLDGFELAGELIASKTGRKNR